ncbi:MAG: hypothetical protein ABI721_05215 [Candidatus Dojkabacteria bacterium]
MNIGLIGLLICQVLLVVFALYLIISWINQTPFYPSSVKKLDKLIKDGEIKLPDDVRFVDIGSGDGRFVVWAARSGFSKADGIEYNPFLSLFAKFRLLISRLNGKSTIHNKDFNKHDFSDYNVAYMYIFSEHMDRIKQKLFSEMKPGSMVISNTFKFKDLEPDQVVGRFNIYKVK